MTRSPLRVVQLVAGLAAAAALFVVAPASANHVQCGDTITQSTTLDSDLVNCPGNGIRIFGAGITLDLGGHTVDGSGGGQGITTTGEDDPAGTVIRNGIVRQFFIGVVMDAAHGGTLARLAVTQNAQNGVAVLDTEAPTVRNVHAFGNGVGLTIGGNVFRARILNVHAYDNGAGMGGGLVFNSVIEGNFVHDNQYAGIGFTFSENNHIAGNRVVNNGTAGILLQDGIDGNRIVANRVTGSGTDGIVLTGESIGANLFRGNNTHRNGDDGIDIDGPGSTLTKNTANFNIDLGIEAEPGTIDGNGNKAQGNGNPAQCVGVSCS